MGVRLEDLVGFRDRDAGSVLPHHKFGEPILDLDVIASVAQRVGQKVWRSRAGSAQPFNV